MRETPQEIREQRASEKMKGLGVFIVGQFDHHFSKCDW